MNPSSIRWSLAVAALAVVVTLGFRALLPSSLAANESTDYAHFYRPVAESLLRGKGLHLPTGSPAVRYPPGYPLILAATLWVGHVVSMRESASIGLMIALATALSASFLYRIARLIAPPGAAFIATAAWLTYPPALWLTKQPNSEVVFMPVLFGLMLLFWHAHWINGWTRWRAFSCGLLAACAMLIRPAYIYIGVVLAALALLTPRKDAVPGSVSRKWVAVLLLCGNLVAVAPWEVIAFRQTGDWIPLSSGGVPSIRDGLTYRLERDAVTGSERNSLTRLQGELKIRLKSASSLGEVAGTLGWSLREHPKSTLQLLAAKLVRPFYATDSLRHEAPLALIQVVYGILIVLCAAAAWATSGRIREMAGFNLLLLAASWAMTVLVLSILRYVVPTISLFFPLIAAHPRLAVRLSPQRKQSVP